VISYLVIDRGRFTIDSFLESLGRPLRRRIRVVPYERLWTQRRLEAGAYVFTDLERLLPRELELASEVFATLRDSGAPVRLLNDPARAMTRYRLLRMLYERGANDYDVLRLSEGRWPRGYPVFLRGEHDHDGSRTALLTNEAELRAAMTQLAESGVPPDATLVVEHRDTSDRDGVYRKYGAFYVNGRVVARHVLFGREWMLKRPYLLEPEYLEEERRYVEENPHEAGIRDLFEQAGIDYGRVDYSVAGDRIVVWEINTNPMIYAWRDDCDGLRSDLQRAFVARFLEALEECDLVTAAAARIPLRLASPPVTPWRRRARMRLHDALLACGLAATEPRILGVLSLLERTLGRDRQAAARGAEPRNRSPQS
jgi:hypothetical protein